MKSPFGKIIIFVQSTPMKIFRTFLLSILILLVSAAFSQKIKIKPGNRAGAIKLGMKLREVTEILGGEFEVRSYSAEKSAFEGQYDPATLLQFKLGFDSCVVYSNAMPKYPFFKLYFKNDALNYFILTRYGADEAIIKRYVLPGKVRFGDNKEKTLKKFPKPEEVVSIESYDGDYYWLTQGMELLFDPEMGLAVVYIFTPIP